MWPLREREMIAKIISVVVVFFFPGWLWWWIMYNLSGAQEPAGTFTSRELTAYILAFFLLAISIIYFALKLSKWVIK